MTLKHADDLIVRLLALLVLPPNCLNESERSTIAEAVTAVRVASATIARLDAEPDQSRIARIARNR